MVRRARHLGLAAMLVLAVAMLGTASGTASDSLKQVATLVGNCTRMCVGPNGTGEHAHGAFGTAVTVSRDGSTMLIAAPNARKGDGAVWVFVRHGGSWEQQGRPLIDDCTSSCRGPNGTGSDGNTFLFGTALALSGNGDTALIGAPGNGERGGAWVFTRTDGHWSQQGPRLIAFCHVTKRTCTGPNGTGQGGASFGQAVALSGDGDTALIGAPFGPGGVWAFTRSGGGWSQTAKLINTCKPRGDTTCTGPNGTGGIRRHDDNGGLYFGTSIALTPDGRTAVIGDSQNRSNGVDGSGAAWVFKSTGGTWHQDGPPLVSNCSTGCGGPNGTGETGEGQLGNSVAISADGRTTLIGAYFDDNFAGSAYVFARSAAGWSQQGPRLVADCQTGCSGPNGTGEINISGRGVDFAGGELGSGVALSSAGDTAVLGAPNAATCHCRAGSLAGSVWLFTRSSGRWSQDGANIVADCTEQTCTGPNGSGEDTTHSGGQFGTSVAIAGDSGTLLIGAPNNDCTGDCPGSGFGAAWVFRRRH